MALQCGINANLLRRWITQSMGTDMKTGRTNMPTVAMVGADAFVPLRLAAPGAVPVGAAALKVRLHAGIALPSCPSLYARATYWGFHQPVGFVAQESTG
jgi:hypothetical protein